MKKLLMVAVCFLPAIGYAQTVPTPVTPAPISGFGTLSVLVASLATSTLTLGPNSAAYPTGTPPNRYFTIRNSPKSADTLYVCPLGGTCTSSVGIPLGVGESKTWMIPASAGSFPAVSVISGSTATAIMEW